MQIDIGIKENDRNEIAESLKAVLADTYTLYLKTHHFHWNVTGPMFNTLHLMFETQYNELWITTDEIAERIRSLGVYSPGTYSEFARLTSIKESEDVPSASQMIKELVEGHETCARTARAVMSTAGDAEDEATVDLLTQRLTYHEKTAWMLRSLLES